jgi:F0F1-type ATP synthase assembly protein I
MAADGLGLSDLLGLGAGLAALLVAGMGLGWLVDTLAHTFPIFVFIGLGLGIVGACAYTIVEFRKYLGSSNTRTSGNSEEA